MQDGRWHIRWRPLHTPSGIDCRIEHLAATRDVFRTSHEGTREWSPFNYELVARVIHGDSLVGAAFGKHVTIDGSGGVDVEPLNDEGRRVGESHPKASLSDHEVELMLTLREEGMTYAWLVEKARSVLDTRNATKKVTEHRDKITLL